MDKHRLNLIVGRTGSGKSTLAHTMCKLFPDKFAQVKSYSTRPQREIETDHIFIAPEEVPKFRGKMAAYTKIGEYEYFTVTEDLINNNIYVIDPAGCDCLKTKCADRYDFCTLYLDLPEEERIERLRRRGDSTAIIATRLAAEHAEFAAFEEARDYDISIKCEDHCETQLAQMAKDAIDAFWAVMDEEDE